MKKNILHTFLLILALVLTILVAKNYFTIRNIILSENQVPKSYVVNNVVDQTLDDDAVETEEPKYGIYGLKIIANLGDSQYQIVSGTECTDCDDTESIYIISKVTDQVEEGRYSYPGKEYYVCDTEGSTLIRESRMFYGTIFQGVTGIVWYQNEYDEKNKAIPNAYVFAINAHGEIEEGYLDKILNGEVVFIKKDMDKDNLREYMSEKSYKEKLSQYESETLTLKQNNSNSELQGLDQHICS